MVEAALRRPPPVSGAEWLKTLPPAARWVLHGDAQARARAAPAASRLNESTLKRGNVH